MSVNVEKVGDRIWLTSTSITPGLSKSISGARFSKEGGAHWSLPLNLETCALLRMKFGRELQIGPDLWDWAKAQKAAEAEMAELRTGNGVVELKGAWREDYPVLFRAVQHGRPYQALGAQWIANAVGSGVLIGDTVGLGKTPQALAGVKESGVPGPYLVVCPKTAVESVWAPEIHRWLPGDIVITLPEGRAKRDEVLNAFRNTVKWPNGQEQASLARTWVVVHPEAIRSTSWWICRECGSRTPKTSKPKELVCEHDSSRTTIEHDHTFPQLFQVPWGVVIADESDRSIISLTGTPTQTRNGMELLRDTMSPDGVRVAQSGTPFRSKPHLLWSTLNWLQPKTYTSRWTWFGTFFEIEEGYGGSRKVLGLRPDREELLYKSLDRIMLRRTRAEVASHLPPKQYIGTPMIEGDENSPVGVWLDMAPQQAKAYRQIIEQSSAEVEGGRVAPLGILAEMTRLKQLATAYGRMSGDTMLPAFPSNKYDYLVEMLIELGYPEDPQAKVVVVSQFTSVLKLFGQALEVEFKKRKGLIGFITGQVTGLKRQATIESVNAPLGRGIHILMLNTQAGGSAITLDGADEMVFLDQTWIPDDQEQAEGRIDNRRPEEKIVQRRYRYLMSRESIDAGVALVNYERGTTGHEILDGRRGLEYVRQVLKASR